MEALRQEALTLIRTLKETLSEEEPLFASANDCDYFRSLYRTQSRTSYTIPAKDATEPKPLSREPLPEKKPPPPKAGSPPPVSVPESSQPPPREILETFEDLRKLMAKIAPKIRIVDEIPDDAVAKQVSQRYKTRNQAAPISLLTNMEPPQHRKLLEHLTQALDVAFGGARLIQCSPIEKEKQWEAFLSVNGLKHVVICDSTLWQLPHLLQFYREVPSHSERFLHNVPLFLLPDLSLYLKDPLLKRSLWKALCSKIA